MSGHTFFIFPNPDATLGVRLPAWSFTDRAWIPDYLPIEEFAFYILGALFMIAVYLWADVNWVSDYEPRQYANLAAMQRRIIDFTPVPLLICAVLIAAGFLFKRFGAHPYNDGLPGYFTFQMLLAFLPTAVFLRGVRDFINWRAFAFAYFLLLLLSLLWEATLGVPYGWWDYKPESMLGIRITAWSNLPLEAVLLWLVAAWGAVVSFEFWRLVAHRRRTRVHPGDVVNET